MTVALVPPTGSPSVSATRRLFDRYQKTGDPAALEALVVRFMPLARSLARRYRWSPEPLDDLEQVAYVGLLKAIDRFDLDRQTAFSTFAVPSILGEIKRHFRDRTWTVRVPRDLQELALRVNRAEGELAVELGRTPGTADIAARLEICVEAVLDAMAVYSAYSPDSLDRPRGSDDGEGKLGFDVRPVEEAGYDAAEDAAILAPLLRHLDAHEREILRLRFEEDLTQTQIGARIGCSQMHVSRLLRRAITRLEQAHEQGLACAGPTRRQA